MLATTVDIRFGRPGSPSLYRLIRTYIVPSQFKNRPDPSPWAQPNTLEELIGFLRWLYAGPDLQTKVRKQR